MFIPFKQNGGQKCSPFWILYILCIEKNVIL